MRPRGELLFISANGRRHKRRSGGGTSIDLALPLWSPHSIVAAETHTSKIRRGGL
jgi:hypothetical protein